MANIYVGSARHDENGKLSGGMAGDQKQTSVNDVKGEVSMQLMYTHSKGWYILRPIMPGQAETLANAMITACNNPNIGYDQGNRTGALKYGINTTVKTETDCSGLVRACIKHAMNVDVGNFTTADELKVLVNSGLFVNKGAYINQSKTPVYNGDVLVTRTKGHTVIVVTGSPRVADVAKPTLRKGSKGSGVKLLQQNINKVSGSKLTLDGDFGSKTKSALEKWQSSVGLTADGIYGPKSADAMKRLLQ